MISLEEVRRYKGDMLWKLRSEMFVGAMELEEYRRRKKAGYVYMLRCHARYKIGRTLNPAHRIPSLCAMMPYECEVLALGQFKDHSGKESHLHRTLKERGRHRRGEWFELSREEAARLVEIINKGDENDRRHNRQSNDTHTQESSTGCNRTRPA